MKMYTIHDRAAEVYNQPTFTLNEKIMLRILQNCLADPTHNFALNPDDYTLFEMGEYDDNTGLITGELKKITNLLALKPQQVK